jgi:hypothetical protein
MKMQHPPYHWIMVALVLVALLLTLSEAHGQSAGAAATFQGRPALSGAQAGEGALAGPPQGGIGVQGSDLAERGLHLRKPSGVEEMPQGKGDENAGVAAAANTDAANADAAKNVTPRRDIAPARDQSLAKDQRSSAKATKRAAKRTLSRARHGVAEIDSAAPATGR